MWNCAFLVFLCVCPLLDKVGSEARAGFSRGQGGDQGVLELMPAHWHAELGPRPPCGQSRGMSRGSGRLRMAVGSLFADGWGYVSTQLRHLRYSSTHAYRLLGGAGLGT